MEQSMFSRKTIRKQLKLNQKNKLPLPHVVLYPQSYDSNTKNLKCLEGDIYGHKIYSLKINTL
jgi:hypothetical protein